MIAVVADGGPQVGLGHLGRSSAVAVALRSRGLEVRAFAYGAEDVLTLDGIEWVPYSGPPGGHVVLDTYTMPAAERAALAPLAVFHDEGDLPDARLVIKSGAAWTTSGCSPACGMRRCGRRTGGCRSAASARASSVCS